MPGCGEVTGPVAVVASRRLGERPGLLLDDQRGHGDRLLSVDSLRGLVGACRATVTGGAKGTLKAGLSGPWTPHLELLEQVEGDTT